MRGGRRSKLESFALAHASLLSSSSSKEVRNRGSPTWVSVLDARFVGCQSFATDKDDGSEVTTDVCVGSED